MRGRVLQKLLANVGKRISGEEMSGEFDVTRAAIWKHIKNLRDQGYEIESSTGGGYRLTAIPDVLSKEQIRHFMSREWNVQVLDTTLSTNKDAVRWAEEGGQTGDTVVAICQDAGRGRFAREWTSPEGGIWMSTILRTSLEHRYLPPITLLAAVAVAQTLEEMLGDIPLQIKWPNDILVNHQKLCGILVEGSLDLDGVKYMIVGIGINANVHMENLGITQPATSLKDLGYSVNRAELIARVVERFMDFMHNYEDSPTLAPYLDYYNQRMAFVGQSVSLQSTGDSKAVMRGILQGLHEDGSLKIFSKGAMRYVVSGELSLRSDTREV